MQLLAGEELLKRLKPHPLAFLRYWIIPIGLWVGSVLLGWLSSTDGWSGFEDSVGGITSTKVAAALVLAVIILAIWAVVGFALFFSMRRQWVFWLPVLVVGVALVFALDPPGMQTAYSYLIAVGVVAVIYIEVDRLTYSYYITSSRIIMRKAFVSVRERQVRVEHIQDLVTHQGLLGRLFNYGTIVPITQGQIGIGDEGKALMTGGGVRGPLGRAEAGAGVAVIRSKRTPTEDPADVLFGVPDPTEVKTLLAYSIAESSQVGELRRIRALLEREGIAPTVKDEKGPGPNAPSTSEGKPIPREGGV